LKKVGFEVSRQLIHFTQTQTAATESALSVIFRLAVSMRPGRSC